ncbi:hypothetical protein AAZX31_11G196900 [Glycine max]|uniref:Protein CHUP1, chloroplastic n=2 Tax=Glycine max TaxID=3847 RepID=I1LLL9_SOYBN|nr:protein CHUP1, chloroplastic isoform X2 [Glycine max]KAG4989339.1 hypothetical protein JHK85_032322 [Glycine max]KAG5124928.1 hypothetical protein JHK82_031665 [Glycine max]KAH1159835.1 hypothetical protein GYH30_031538 [Glycine max]KRH30271.1 hypothetical protein GLYMA_11G171900v4 [Glycine max]|eukprot:XP_006591221.1 protein CHUP1, chloroplastic isoform X1 [Glycine max]
MLIISVLAVINSSLLFFCLFIFSQFAFALFFCITTHTITILLRREEGGKMSLENDSEITHLKKNLKVQMERNVSLEKENKDLRQEVARLKSQIMSLKAHNIERKSMLWKKIQKSMDGNNSDTLQHKAAVKVIMLEKSPPNERVHTNSDLQETPIVKDRSVKVPPPAPSSNPLLPSQKTEKGMKVQPLALPRTAPPPPPTPPKSLVGLKSVRRVPEVIELYRSLTRKDANNDNKISTNGTPAAAFTRNMIEEIENRSTFLSAIKSDVQRQREFISLLIKEVESAAYADISEVEAFVKWLDGELSSLVDERSVLKHFPHWPEQKTDALREASCNYRNLKSLESEVSSFENNPKEPLAQALKKMQALQDRLERSVNSAEKTRESASKRYRSFHIPWEWMLDTGLIGQMKLSSLKLAREFMKRVTKELESNEVSKEDNLLVQGVRFAFRVHQFAGGFDSETIQAFQELKKIGSASTKL